MISELDGVFGGALTASLACQLGVQGRNS